MAEFSFEPSTEHSSVAVWLRRPDKTNTHGDHLVSKIRGRSTKVHYQETAQGELTISNIDEQDKEVLRRAVFATNKDSSGWQVRTLETGMIEFTDEQRAQQLSHIDQGFIKSSAILHRSGALAIAKSGQVSEPNPKLGSTRISSFAGNLDIVGRMMLNRIQEELEKNGQDYPVHYQEIATDALELKRAVLTEVEPALVAINGLSVTVIETRLAEKLAGV